MPVGLGLQIILVVEGELGRVGSQVSRLLSDDEPDGADEVRDDEDEERRNEMEEIEDASGSVSRAARTGRTTWRVAVCEYNV